MISLDEAMNLTPDVVRRMTTRELKEAIGVVKKSVRAAYRRFEKTELGRMSPAFMQWEREGRPTYNVRGLNRNQLQHVFKMARNARARSTATVTGYREYRRRVFRDDQDVKGGGFFGGNADTERAFWDLVEILESEFPNVPSDTVIGVCFAVFGDSSIAPEDREREIRRRLTEIYEQAERNKVKRDAESGDWFNLGSDIGKTGPGADDLPF